MLGVLGDIFLLYSITFSGYGHGVQFFVADGINDKYIHS